MTVSCTEVLRDLQYCEMLCRLTYNMFAERLAACCQAANCANTIRAGGAQSILTRSIL